MAWKRLPKHAGQEIAEAFARADFPEVIRLFDQHFGESTYSLRSLFRDEQRKVLHVIMGPMLAAAETAYRQIYQQHVPLMRFLSDLYLPQPQTLQAAAEFILNVDLRRALEADDFDVARIQALFDEAQQAHVSLDEAGLGYALAETLHRLSRQMLAELSTPPADLTGRGWRQPLNLAHAFPGEVEAPGGCRIAIIAYSRLPIGSFVSRKSRAMLRPVPGLSALLPGTSSLYESCRRIARAAHLILGVMM